MISVLKVFKLVELDPSRGRVKLRLQEELSSSFSFGCLGCEDYTERSGFAQMESRSSLTAPRTPAHIHLEYSFLIKYM